MITFELGPQMHHRALVPAPRGANATHSYEDKQSEKLQNQRDDGSCYQD
jgi:hypothetical protein